MSFLVSTGIPQKATSNQSGVISIGSCTVLPIRERRFRRPLPKVGASVEQGTLTGVRTQYM